MEHLEAKLQHALLEIQRLKMENLHLKEQLSMKKTPVSTSLQNSSSTKHTSKEQILHERINIFKNLFKGRSDVYAVRWESKSGKSGYSPACRNEWNPTLCNKPKIKCSDCQHRVFLPLTDQVIDNHLTGKKTIGLYPLLEDENCWFLAVDFDKSSWQEDVLAFTESCKRLNVPTSIERSRSGNGCHVGIFFEQKFLQL
jgi:hypothetical protein